MNGWTNYETWRVNLEFFSDHPEDFNSYDEAQLKDYVTSIIFNGARGSKAAELAYAFVDQANYTEIMLSIQECCKEVV